MDEDLGSDALPFLAGVAAGVGLSSVFRRRHGNARDAFRAPPPGSREHELRRQLVVYQDPYQGDKWTVTPNLLDVVALGPDLEITWKIIDSPGARFPDNAVTFTTECAEEQFPCDKLRHGSSDRIFTAYNRNTNTNLKLYEYTIHVVDRDGNIVSADPGIGNGSHGGA